ncbi:histidine--tRNA ligase [bacterium]|nr:histidine--tRNA ligase [bacterium]
MSSTNTAKGTRDFSRNELAKRNYLFDVIKDSFTRFGFAPLETPAMENIETLTGKYGDEGDQLLFRILRSGDFLKDLEPEDLSHEQAKKIRSAIADKGLRYDLTIPFARFIAKNHAQLGLPYKRFQIQPVWRADRPARGRYREFYQCDADVAGTTSLLSDTEFILIVDDVFNRLKLPTSVYKLNNRKVLAGFAQTLQRADAMTDMTVAIDKLDKIGMEGVEKELAARGFNNEDIDKIKNFTAIEGNNNERLDQLQNLLAGNEMAVKGIAELREVLGYVNACTLQNTRVEVDFSLARGLNYYTGTIYEVQLDGVNMGSVASGGRYDNLTESFGVKDVPGVGLSFGAERLYDVMEQLDLFPATLGNNCQVLVLNLDEKHNAAYLNLSNQLRNSGIATELYVQKAKLGKQMKFAEKREIPYVLIAGETEFAAQQYQLKNLETGEQNGYSLSQIIEILNK